VDQIRFGIPVLKFGKLKPQEPNRRILRDIVVNDLPCFQLDNEKDVKGDKAECGDGKEVTGKKRIPVSAEELFPGKVRFQVAGDGRGVQLREPARVPLRGE
jgi:hypothetical protein